MEKKYFYVKPDSTKPTKQKEIIYKIDVKDIENLALLALSLEPFEDVNKSLGHIAALNDYFSKNKNQEKIECYKKLTSNIMGNTILYTIIELCLLEKKFREEGIREPDVSLYNQIQRSYQEQLEFNHKQLKESSPKRKF